jgi:hypothetical protein
VARHWTQFEPLAGRHITDLLVRERECPANGSTVALRPISHQAATDNGFGHSG